MPVRMTGRGRKNPFGYVSKTLESQYTTATFPCLDVDASRDVSTATGIGSPNGSSSGVQFYSMTFDLASEPGGITAARIQRMADTRRTESDGKTYTYLTYRVALTIDQNSSQRSLTIGAPMPPIDQNANFYFSSLDIGSGFAISGRGNVAGTSARDCLNGSDGHDTIDGKGGKDYMRGGKGNDTYIVYDGNTLIDEAPQTGIETVISSVDWYLNRRVSADSSTETTGTGLDHLTLVGNAAINGTGNELPNVIKGNNAKNVLSGEAGNDTLIGGGGNDTLIGGSGSDELNGFGTSASTASQFDILSGEGGSDYFVLGGAWGVSYVEPQDGYAVITDWTATQDRIKVKRVSGGTYSLEFKSLGGIGSALPDTEIYFTDSRGFKDRIGIVRDNVTVQISRDFVFV